MPTQGNGRAWERGNNGRRLSPLHNSLAFSFRFGYFAAMSATRIIQHQPTQPSGLLHQLVEALLAAGQPERIILFGSRARGDNREDSDVDLLIVQASQPGGSRWKELRRFRDALRGFPIAKDLLLFRPNEFDYWRDSLNHVVGRAVREGRLLYERS